MHNMKPMLSGKADLKKLRYPTWGSLKLDGVRSTVKDYGLLSRSLKPIPNQHTQNRFRKLGDGLDGELIVGAPNVPEVFSLTQSSVMTKHGTPDVNYYLFDLWNMPGVAYHERYEQLRDIVVVQQEHYPLYLLEQYPLRNEKEVLAFEEWAVNNGYEGIMLRDPDGVYKFGRSTTNEGILLKFKRWEDSEAVVLRVIEAQHNENEGFIDERGYTKRSSHKDNKRPAGWMGALEVRDIHNGKEFEIGMFKGLTREERVQWWVERDDRVGRIVTYKYIPYGDYEKPRIAVYKGLRDPRDMS